MADDPRSDEQLVDAANCGEAAALEALYLRYRAWVMARAARICGAEDAADVLQDAFIYVFGKFPGFELRARFTTFLYPVVRNLALARLRRRGRVLPLDEADMAAEHAESVPLLDAEAGMRDIVDRLPPAQQEAVLLRFVDGLTQAEIAQALGVPVGTVKSRLHHAIANLRRSLSGRPSEKS